MRLVGIAFLTAWLVAWSVAPHGERARATTVVGAVAAAGTDPVALAWLDVPHGRANGTLHLIVVEGEDRIGVQTELPSSATSMGFRLADAGAGRFVLASEHRTESRHWFEVHRIDSARHQVLPDLDVSLDAGAWQLAAAGDEVAISVDLGNYTHDFALTAEERWSVPATGQLPQRTWLGAGGGHVVKYVENGERRESISLVVAPERPTTWTAHPGAPQLPRGECFGPTQGGHVVVASVTGLRGGFARLLRLGAVGCVDGMRDGAPFLYKKVPLRDFWQPRLVSDASGRLTIEDEPHAQTTLRRVVLPEDPAAAILIDKSTVHPRLVDGAVRYRVFAGEGPLGVTDLATRVSAQGTEVFLERQGTGEARLLAPMRQFHRDARPLLRKLAIVPLGFLLFGLVGLLRVARRIRSLVPTFFGGSPAPGQATIAGTLVIDADAPAGGLRVRVGRSLLTLFIEGADILRASSIRSRTQPRGDAVDVAAGAQVVATGTVEPGAIYRDETCLRAREGDLVLVGCSLAEARAGAARRVLASAAVLGCAIAMVLTVALRG